MNGSSNFWHDLKNQPLWWYILLLIIIAKFIFDVVTENWTGVAALIIGFIIGSLWRYYRG